VQIGKCAAENRLTKAAKHFAILWKVDINELTARRLRAKYLEKLEETVKGSNSDLDEDEPVDTLPKCKQGRPLLLDKDQFRNAWKHRKQQELLLPQW